MSDKTLEDFYYRMLRIRLVQEKIAEHYPEQKMRCPVHLCIGQEAIAVGVCAALKKEDYVLSNHRSHGHYLAKGGNLKAMLAEIYGKATGCAKGKGGSMHLVDPAVNVIATPIVGGIIPVGVGMAFGAGMKDEKNVAVIFLGDAAAEGGGFYESLNFAALKKLPVVFVCENNFYSVYSSLSSRQPAERDNITLARAFGMHSARGDGNDVSAVYEMAGHAIDIARNGGGPSLIEFDTYRWLEHCGPNFDDHLGYRAECEVKEWLQRCPLENLKSRLLNDGTSDPDSLEQMKRTIIQEIEEAFVFAEESPFPDKSEMLKDVYA